MECGDTWCSAAGLERMRGCIERVTWKYERLRVAIERITPCIERSRDDIGQIA